MDPFAMMAGGGLTGTATSSAEAASGRDVNTDAGGAQIVVGGGSSGLLWLLGGLMGGYILARIVG